VRRTEVFSVALALRQEQTHACACFGLNMLDLQPAELITAKAPPEADQQQCHVAPAAQQTR